MGNDNQFSKAESKRRFEAALRGALTTPPKPLKDIAPKRSKGMKAANKRKRSSDG